MLMVRGLRQRLRRGSGRCFAPSWATAAALPARLRTNCPASSLRSLWGLASAVSFQLSGRTKRAACWRPELCMLDACEKKVNVRSVTVFRSRLSRRSRRVTKTIS
jgi:hypothetical protein